MKAVCPTRRLATLRDVDGAVGLVKPLVGRLDGKDVAVLDLGPNGALIEHRDRLSGGETRLAFEFEGERIDIICRVGGSRLQEKLSDREQRLVYHSAVEFPGERQALHRALATHERRLTELQEANVAGTGADPDPTAMYGRALRERSVGYVSYVLRDGRWRRFETMSPEQPLYGFTVAAHQDDDRLELLRMAYEEADAEGRRLLRQFAAASVEGAS